MFWRKRHYSEAYLEIKRNKITATEKTKREELGADPPNKKEEEGKSESVHIATVSPELSVNTSGTTDVEVDETGEDSPTPYEEEDERVVERPRSKLAWAMLAFWVVFIIVALQFFVPSVQHTLGQTIDYSEFSLDSLFNRESSLSEDATNLSEAVVDTVEEATPQVDGSDLFDRFTAHVQEAAPSIAENTQNALDFAQSEFAADDLRVYARTHRLIRDTTSHVRNTTQRYVIRKGQYVEIVAMEGRIRTDMERARQMLSETENTALKAKLLTRIDRLEHLSTELRGWDRASALEGANVFVRAENQDSDEFIAMLKARLDAEERSYYTENGIFYFD